LTCRNRRRTLLQARFRSYKLGTFAAAASRIGRKSPLWPRYRPCRLGSAFRSFRSIKTRPRWTLSMPTGAPLVVLCCRNARSVRRCRSSIRYDSWVHPAASAPRAPDAWRRPQRSGWPQYPKPHFSNRMNGGDAFRWFGSLHLLLLSLASPSPTPRVAGRFQQSVAEQAAASRITGQRHGFRRPSGPSLLIPFRLNKPMPRTSEYVLLRTYSGAGVTRSRSREARR